MLNQAIIYVHLVCIVLMSNMHSGAHQPCGASLFLSRKTTLLECSDASVHSYILTMLKVICQVLKTQFEFEYIRFALSSMVQNL